MARVFLDFPNPDGTDPVVYTSIVVERAPNVAGAPGAWAQVATIAIDTSNEKTQFADPSGAIDSWYRISYTNGAANSDISSARQVGGNIIRDRILNEMPLVGDSSIDYTLVLVDQWLDEVLETLRLESLFRHVPYQDYTPAASLNDVLVGLRADVRLVYRVDEYYSGNYGRMLENQWRQQGRNVRMFNLSPSCTYRIWGKGDIRTLADMDDEFYPLLRAGVMVLYWLWRAQQRASFKATMSQAIANNASIEELRRNAGDAQKRYERLLEAAREDAEATTAESL